MVTAAHRPQFTTTVATDEDFAAIAETVGGDIRPHVFVGIPTYDDLRGMPDNLAALYKPNSTWFSVAAFKGDENTDIGQIRSAICEAGRRSAADYIVMLDDDVFPQKDGLQRLLQVVRDHDDEVIAVGSYHLRKSTSKTSVNMELAGKKLRPMREDGALRPAYYAAFGFAVIPTKLLERIPQPWFVLEPKRSEDCYFSDKCRDAGIPILCDTGIQCDHVDRDTGIAY
ncbi:MAG: glycosyltransferase [Thermomicrobiales bacterium]